MLTSQHLTTKTFSHAYLTALDSIYQQNLSKMPTSLHLHNDGYHGDNPFDARNSVRGDKYFNTWTDK